MAGGEPSTSGGGGDGGGADDANAQPSSKKPFSLSFAKVARPAVAVAGKPAEEGVAKELVRGVEGTCVRVRQGHKGTHTTPNFYPSPTSSLSLSPSPGGRVATVVPPPPSARRAAPRVIPKLENTFQVGNR